MAIEDMGPEEPEALEETAAPEDADVPSAPTAALVLGSDDEEASPAPTDILVSVSPPTESFSAFGVTVTQDFATVPATIASDLRRSAAEAGVTLNERTAS